MLTITNGAKVVGGKSLEAYLRDELTAFRKGGPEGEALLGQVLDSGGAKYEVVIKDDAPTATSGTRVTINPKETRITEASDLTGLREFAESTIFELTNATNADKFKTLETGLIQGAAIRAYGREKARLEAQASWSVSQILQQRSGYQPSKWGLAQIAACAPYSDVAGFGAAFQSQAHDSKAGKSAASLPSDQYYAFNRAYTIGGTKGAFDQQFKSLTLGGKVLTLEKVKSNVKQSSRLNRMNMLSVTFYHVVLDLLKSPPSGMKLAYTWRGTPTDRDFSDGMKAIAADTGDALKNEVIRALPKACV